MAITDLLSSDPVSAFRSKINAILEVVNIAAKDLSGTLASRPAAGSVDEGTYYFATDNEITYRSDGANWKVVGVRPTGSVADSELASSNNSIYRTLLVQAGLGVNFAGTYILGTQSSGDMLQSGQSISHADMVPGFAPIYFDNDDPTVAGKTQKLRLRAQVNNNGTAWSSVTATFGLYPVSFSGGVDSLTITLGTVVPGSTVAIANPPANTTSPGDSGDFTIPSDGQYCIGVVTSNLLNTNSESLFTAQLQTRHV